MNKIIVSIVFAIILVIGINKITDGIFYVEKPEKSAYSIQIAETTTAADTTTSETSSESSQGGDIMALFASASAADGQQIFKKSCSQCHSIAVDGKNKLGPRLWGIISRQAGSIPDYKYSKAMVAYGKKWTFDELNNFLIKPKAYIKNTKMAYIGLKSAKHRADLILYLNQNSDNPLPVQ